MPQKPYLLFDLNRSTYAIDAIAVQEIFFLPALTEVTDGHGDVVGIISLRGEILTIIDLNHRLGKLQQPYTLNHSVIVVQWEHHCLGMVVNQVYGVEEIPQENISSSFLERSSRNLENPVVLGMAQYHNDIIPILNPQALVQERSSSTPSGELSQSLTPEIDPDSYTPLAPLNGHRSKTPGQAETVTFQAITDPHAPKQGLVSLDMMAQFSPQEQEVLRERAKSLRHVQDDDGSAGLLPLAVVGLQGEYFGLNLENIHEFTEIHQTTPIPCCPNHVVGNINLRGEILTLVDISHLLQLQIQKEGEKTNHTSTHFSPGSQQQQAVVVRLDKLVAGITVDTVYDVVYLHPSEVSPVPAAVHAMNEDFIRGVASYKTNQMSILDLSKILTSEDLVVNESI